MDLEPQEQAHRAHKLERSTPQEAAREAVIPARLEPHLLEAAVERPCSRRTLQQRLELAEHLEDRMVPTVQKSAPLASEVAAVAHPSPQSEVMAVTVDPVAAAEAAVALASPTVEPEELAEMDLSSSAFSDL